MVDYKEDLWPDEIEYTQIISPVTIIKEQGKILGRKTNNVVVGEVKPFKSPHPNDFPFIYTFILVCSSINYEYELFKFGFSIEMYPFKIVLDNSIANDPFLSHRNPEIIRLSRSYGYKSSLCKKTS